MALTQAAAEPQKPGCPGVCGCRAASVPGSPRGTFPTPRVSPQGDDAQPWGIWDLGHLQPGVFGLICPLQNSPSQISYKRIRNTWVQFPSGVKGFADIGEHCGCFS